MIHCSANTRQILTEIQRVLRPGGRAITMVYHRNFWNYYVVSGFFRGLLGGQLFKAKSLNALLQQQTDGALARHYTEQEWSDLVSDLFNVEYSRVYGMKVELLPLPRGRLKSALEQVIPDGLSRLLTNRAKLGTFLVTSLAKSRPRDRDLPALRLAGRTTVPLAAGAGSDLASARAPASL